MNEQKKKMSKAKFFALVISIGLHVVIFYYLGKMALDYALPKGEVTSYEMNFTNDGATATEVAVVEEAPKPSPPPPPIDSAPVKPVAEKKVATPLKPQAPKPVASLPSKENVESEVSDQQGTLPVATEVAELTETPSVTPSETPEEPALVEEASPVPEPIAESEVIPSEALNEDASATSTPQALTLGTTEGVFSDTVLVPFPTNQPISYPTMARFRKLEGLTIVHYNVSGAGDVTDVKIMQSSGHAVLDNQAVETIKNWKFKATGRDGVYERPIRYSLKGDARAAPSQLRRIGK